MMPSKNKLNSKVVLLSPPSRSFNHYRPPLALMYIAGYLENNAYPSEIVDIILDKQVRDARFFKNREKWIKEIHVETVKRVAALRPDIVGITCYTPEYFEVLNLAKDIKRLNQSLKIIVGGIHPTFYPEDFCFNGSPCDVAVIGEGEETMLDIVKAFRTNHKLKTIDGIAFFDKTTKKMIKTNKRNVCQDLNSISFPAYNKINMEYYTTASPYAIRGVYLRSMYILFSRGCPSQCTFCVAKKLRKCSGGSNYLRLRDPKKVFEEILLLREKYKIDSFYFIDDMFTLKKQKVKEFCQLLIRNKLKILWACSSKVSTVDFETLKMMKKAGCIQIDFGIERGSDEALSYIKKGIKVRTVKKVFNDCDRLGIRTFANMLVNIPNETKKDLDDIIKLLTDIKPTIVSMNIFTPYPGTEIFDECSNGITKDDYPLLMENPGYLTRYHAGKFRFAKHNVDFGQWTDFYNKKSNKIWPNLRTHLSRPYLSAMLKSGNKMDYLKQFNSLFFELTNQKFNNQ